VSLWRNPTAFISIGKATKIDLTGLSRIEGKLWRKGENKSEREDREEKEKL